MCVCVRERGGGVTAQCRMCVCVCVLACVREGNTVTHNRGLCENTYEHHYCLSRLCSPFGLELMVKLRTILTFFNFES